MAMTIETIQTITSIVLDLVLIFAGVYALHTAWVVAKWYKEKFKELDYLEKQINAISDNLQEDRIAQMNRNRPNRFSDNSIVEKSIETEKEIKEKQIEILKEKRKHIIERMPFVEIFKK